MARTFTAALLLALCGCGDGSPGPGAQQCAYSGALLGQLPCREASAVWTAAPGTTLLRVLSINTPSPILTAEFTWAGEPAVGKYVGGAEGASCSITLYDASTQASWYASNLPSNANGTCELTLSSVRKGADDGGTRSYELHGTIVASLGAVDQSTSSIGLHGGF